VGVVATDAEYFASQPWPFPLSLMMGFYAKGSYAPLTVDEELEDARWFTRAELHKAVDAGEISFPPPFSIAHFLVRTWLDEA
jgi:NAD+ diphosphatase